jgi:hypothetical protein
MREFPTGVRTGVPWRVSALFVGDGQAKAAVAFATAAAECLRPEL